MKPPAENTSLNGVLDPKHVFKSKLEDANKPKKL